jgi:hypothetical protein
MEPLATVVMSATTFAGSAQFAAASILGAGGGIAAAVTAAVLLNARYGPISISVAPLFRGSSLRRLLEAQLIVDESWAVARRPDGRFERAVLIGAGLVLYVAWVGGTAVGALAGEALADPESLGLDAAFPALFLALLGAAGADAARPRGSARGCRDRPRPHSAHACRRAHHRGERGLSPRLGARVSAQWIVIAIVGTATVALKGLGPVALGGRRLPSRLTDVVVLLAPALLAALVVTQSVGGDRELVADARLVGVATGAVALAFRAPLLAVVVAAAVATALARAVA